MPPFGNEGHFFVGSPDTIPMWSPLVEHPRRSMRKATCCCSAATNPPDQDLDRVCDHQNDGCRDHPSHQVRSRQRRVLQSGGAAMPVAATVTSA